MAEKPASYLANYINNIESNQPVRFFSQWKWRNSKALNANQSHNIFLILVLEYLFFQTINEFIYPLTTVLTNLNLYNNSSWSIPK